MSVDGLELRPQEEEMLGLTSTASEGAVCIGLVAGQGGTGSWRAGCPGVN